MDDKSKRRIRWIAKRLHWLAQLVLFTFLVLNIFAPSILRKAGEEVVSGESMVHLIVPEQVFGEIHLFHTIRRTEELAQFIPPSSTDRYTEWGDLVATHLDQPCAVFYFDGSQSVQWPVLPEQFEPAVAHVENRLRSGTTCDADSPLVREYGTILLERDHFDSTGTRPDKIEKETFSAVFCAMEDSDARWGAVYHMRNFVYPFIRKLQSVKENAPIMDYELRLLDNLFHLRRTPKQQGRPDILTRRAGLRIFESGTDKMLFTTPDLDTTNRKIEMKVESMPDWYEVYASDHDQQWRDEVKDMISEDPMRFPWIGFIIDVFLILVIALFYRWILKLTSPVIHRE